MLHCWAGLYAADPDVEAVFADLRPSEDERLLDICHEEMEPLHRRFRAETIEAAIRIGLRLQEEVGPLRRGTLKSARADGGQPPPTSSEPRRHLTIVRP